MGLAPWDWSRTALSTAIWVHLDARMAAMHEWDGSARERRAFSALRREADRLLGAGFGVQPCGIPEIDPFHVRVFTLSFGKPEVVSMPTEVSCTLGTTN